MANRIERVLVTGGAGFIGAHLAERLVRQGCQVTIVDDLSTGRRENLAAVAERVRFVQGDIRDGQLMADAAAGCDTVFHLAAVVSVTQTVDDPLSTASINDQGTLQVLETARLQGVRRVVLSSSCAVYGDDPQLPKREEHRPRPQSPYAVQKLAGELYAGVYQSLYGLETVSLRYFNVFGPRQDPSSPYSGVISIFMTRAVQDRPVTIYGDGRQYRDFVYVQDVVEANWLAATTADAAGGVFNVGTGRQVRINTLWEEIGRMAGIDRQPVHEPARSGDIRESVADIGRAREVLRFAPAYGFKDGLAATFDWYR